MPCNHFVWDRDDILYGMKCEGREPFLVMLSSKDGIAGDDLKEYARLHREDRRVPPLVDAVYDYEDSVIFIEVKRFAHPRAVLGVVKRLLEDDKISDKALPWGSGWKTLLFKLRQPSFVLPRGYEDVEPLMEFIRTMPENVWHNLYEKVKRLKVRKVSFLQERLIEKYLSTYETLEKSMIRDRDVYYFVLLFAKPLWLSRSDMQIFSYILRQKVWQHIKGKTKGMYILFQGNELLDVDIMYHHYLRGYWHE